MKHIVLILTLLQSPQDTFNSANADFTAGRWADAAAKYEQILKDDPSLVATRFNLAVSYTKLGKTDEAISAYRALLEKNATPYEAHINLALLLDQTGKRAEAGAEFEKAVQLHPDDNQARFDLAMFYMRGNETDKAYPQLLALSEKGVNSAELYAVLGDIEHTRKNEPKSREYYDKAIQLDGGKNPNLIRQLAISHFEEKNYAKAAPLLEQLIKLVPNNADYLYLLGKSYEQLGTFPQALATLQQVLRVKPDYFEAYGTIGAIFYAQKDWGRAAQALTKVVELRPREALAHFVLATCFDNLGNVQDALVHYNKFLELDDRSNDARSFQARERARTLERRVKK